jgi:hypothetical protein
MSAWFYGHSTTATLEWLSRQTRESEMKRAKLDLNKPFEKAAEQITDSEHIWQKKKDGSAIITHYAQIRNVKNLCNVCAIFLFWKFPRTSCSYSFWIDF